jgi:putative spermidine/putrescine transport system ATP-binding protein
MRIEANAGAERASGGAPDIAVSVRGVSMVYNGVHAVKDASFDLPRGRFLTILGPSGSGKSTLLRMIAGFHAPTRGEIVIGGTAVGSVPAHRRSIGMVFQKLALFPHLTAEENVAFPLRMRRTDARRIPERVARYLDLVRLTGLGGRRIHELSGGQQQRVAIARALVFEPDLLLLDEPLAALDRKLREEMQLEFRRIQRELGVTTINVTHDQREALVVSDEIIVMDHGVIQQKARPAEAYRAPSNAFVANFIGVTNFLPGIVEAVDGAVATLRQSTGAVFGGVVPPGTVLAAGDAAAGAVRAEQIRLAAAGAPPPAGLSAVFDGEIHDAIFEGERMVYEVKVPALGGAVLRVFDHDPIAHTAFDRSAAVRVGWDVKDVLVFRQQAGSTGRTEENRT